MLLKAGFWNTSCKVGQKESISKTQINVNVKEMHSRGESLISYLYKIGGVGVSINITDILSVAFNECGAKDVIVLFSKKLQHNTVKMIFIYSILNG